MIFHRVRRRIIFTLALALALAAPALPSYAADVPQQTQAPLIASAATNVPQMERKVSLNAQQMPLKDALAELCRQAKIELDLNEADLKSAEVAADLPVTFSVKDESLESTLWGLLNILRKQGLWDCRYEVRGQKLVFGTFRAEMARTAARTMAALPDWLKPLQGKGVNATVDDEGNVVSLFAANKASDEFLANAKTLPKLRELRLEGIKTVTREGLAHLAELPELEKLQLYAMSGASTGLGDDALRIVSRIKTLRDLTLQDCGLSDGGARAFETMTQLTALSLEWTPITDTALIWVAGLTNLQKLDVSAGREITDIGFRLLSGLTRLEELRVNGRVSGKFLAFPRLQALSANGEHFGDADFDAIVLCRNLRRLELSGMTDRGLSRIATLPELRQLDLYSDEITDGGIAHLKALPKLERLSVRAARVSNESLKHLAEIKSLADLTIYDPHWFGADDRRQFTVEGLLQLKKLPRLHHLMIYGFRSPTGFLGLRELTQLRSLSLDFTPIAREEKELLEWAMPGTHVSAMSGRGANISGLRTPPRPPLPSTSVFLSGRVLDNATGEAITNGVLQFGADDPGKPGEVIWGAALSDPKMEVSGNHPADLSQFWGESFRPGKVWARVVAGGYAPELLTSIPVESPLRLTNLVARMKRGGDLRGMVVDHSGNPAPGVRVYLADQRLFTLGSGTPGSLSGGNNTTTDAGGRFALPGGDGTEQRVVAASPDGQLFAVAPKVGPGREVRISLPQPAAVIVRYDIPDDTPVARVNLNYQTQDLDPAVWKDLSFALAPTVTNGAEIVLTNLTPGNYRVIRGKDARLGSGRGRGGLRRAMLDLRMLTLEADQTQRVDLVRSTGQSIRGQVVGIRSLGAPGAYVYAYSSQTTNDLAGMMSGRQRPLDLVTCGDDGQFQMARLEPGAYTVVALVVVDPDDPVNLGRPDFAGTAQVNITADASPPEPVKIELLPWKTGTN